MKLKIFYEPSQGEIVEILRNEVANKFRFEVTMEKLEIPEEFFNERRKQYRAEEMLTFLSKKISDKEIVIWVVGKDIYSTGTNFIFGLARPNCCALLSTFRLLGNLELIKKEFLHELGHVLGLEHCEKNCLMKFSNSVYEAILKNPEFCSSCKEKIKKFLK